MYAALYYSVLSISLAPKALPRAALRATLSTTAACLGAGSPVFFRSRCIRMPPRTPGNAETRIILPCHLFAGLGGWGGEAVVLEERGYFSGPTGDFAVHGARLAYTRATCAAYADAHGLRRVPLEESERWLSERPAGSGPYVVWDPMDNGVADRMRAALGDRLRVEGANPGFVISDPSEYTGRLSTVQVLDHCRRKTGLMESAASTDRMNRRPPDKALADALKAASRASRAEYGGPRMTQAVEWARTAFPGSPGDPSAAKRFPHTRRQALAALRRFVRERLAHFGPYQDAALLSADRSVSFPGVHSCLSAAMNAGLLHPVECARLAVAELLAGRVPLQSAEAYVRQLLGWREHMRLLYSAHGRELEAAYFSPYPRLPAPWYSGEDAPLPLSLAARRAEDTAFLDHIVRLMVVENIAILSGAHPGGLLRWFTELCAIDAYQWAMVSNIAHMSAMTAGGRRLAPRAYVSSSSYIRRMSDLPAGDWERDVDALFYAYVSKGGAESSFYRGALRGKRYAQGRQSWGALASAAAARLSGHAVPGYRRDATFPP